MYDTYVLCGCMCRCTYDFVSRRGLHSSLRLDQEIRPHDARVAGLSTNPKIDKNLEALRLRDQTNH